MICTCPNCDYFFPLNLEVVLTKTLEHVVCPCCENPFKNFMNIQEEAELGIERIKDELVIEKSLQNIGRWFEDC